MADIFCLLQHECGHAESLISLSDGESIRRLAACGSVAICNLDGYICLCTSYLV